MCQCAEYVRSSEIGDIDIGPAYTFTFRTMHGYSTVIVVAILGKSGAHPMINQFSINLGKVLTNPL
jgi:hypothetical protein